METGFYATGTRYYDPEIGRFFNADDVSMLGANGDFASLNLYAYCGNNPVIRADYSGEFWHIVAGALIGAAFELGSQLIANKGDLSSVNWTKVAIATVVGGVTAACGPWSGALISGVGNVAMEAVEGTTDVKKVATAFAVGAGSSLVGAGVGKVVQKIGGKIAINQLVKKSSSEIKRIISKTINVAGKDRNTIKNLSWTLSQAAYKHLPDELVGKTVPQIFNSLAVGTSGYGTMGAIYE